MKSVADYLGALSGNRSFMSGEPLNLVPFGEIA